MKLTSVDRKIIALLSEDSRMPTSRMADILGIPESTARGRLARLVEAEVVTFVAQTDPIRMGFGTWVMVGLKVDLSAIPSAAADLGRLDEVYFVAVTSGGFDIMFNAVFENDRALHRFLTEKLSRIAGINDTTTFHYLDVSKRKIAFPPPGTEVGD